MRIALLEVTAERRECVNKDFMGGYGWAFHIGPSLRARLIEFAKKSGEGVPLLYFAYLAAIFRDHGHEIQVFRNTIPHNADLVLIHASMIDYKNEIRWAQRIRRENPNCRIGFLGPFATFRPHLFLDHCDFLIAGEVESAGYRLAKGEKLQGVVSSQPVELDKLPFPAWEYFPISEYSYMPALREKPFLTTLSSRGCVYSCDYCPYPVNFKFQTRSPENVLDEIEYLVGRFGMRAMLFRDPLFSANRKRARQIAEGISQRNIKIKWACETRMDLLNEELIEVFYRSGLRVINIGVESSDEALLKKIDRVPISVEHQNRMVRFCDKLGIRVTAFYVLGLPDDNPEKIRATIQYAKELNTHAAMFYLATPFPGTDYYEMVKDKITTADYETMDCFTPVVSHPQLTSAELEKLKEWAYVSYYYRFRWFFSLLRRVWKDVFPSRLGAVSKLPPSSPAEETQI